jgi:hypothetical protein
MWGIGERVCKNRDKFMYFIVRVVVVLFIGYRQNLVGIYCSHKNVLFEPTTKKVLAEAKRSI